MFPAIQPDVPYLPVEEYARRTGVSEVSIRHLVREGRLPIKKKKQGEKKIYINMAALWQHAIEDAQRPENDLFFHSF